MGDRANAYFVGDKGDLYLYTHSEGTWLPETVRQAVLAAKDRWGDPSYALRIIIDQVTKSARDQETGFGLDWELADDNHGAVVVCDLAGQRLAIAPYGAEKDESKWRDVVRWKDLSELESYAWNGAKR